MAISLIAFLVTSFYSQFGFEMALADSPKPIFKEIDEKQEEINKSIRKKLEHVKDLNEKCKLRLVIGIMNHNRTEIEESLERIRMNTAILEMMGGLVNK
jgi:predicted acetyltransferase